MAHSDMVSYFLTLSAITLAPVPFVLVLLVRSTRKGVLGAFSFGVLYALGALLITSVVCFRFGAWLTSIPEFLEYSKYLILVYTVAGYGSLERRLRF